MDDILKKLPRGLIEASRFVMESNKENKAKSSAFRAGKKDVEADRNNTKPYRYRRDSASEYKERVDAAKNAKEAAKDKAQKMKLSAKDKLRSLNKPTGSINSIYNRGKEHAKNIPTGSEINKKIRINANRKSQDEPQYGGSGENRGKFLQMKHAKEHNLIKSKIDDLHRGIRNKLNDLEPDYFAHQQRGSNAIEKAKAHLAKMTKIHAALHEALYEEDNYS